MQPTSELNYSTSPQRQRKAALIGIALGLYSLYSLFRGTLSTNNHWIVWVGVFSLVFIIWSIWGYLRSRSPVYIYMGLTVVLMDLIGIFLGAPGIALLAFVFFFGGGISVLFVKKKEAIRLTAEGFEIDLRASGLGRRLSIRGAWNEVGSIAFDAGYGMKTMRFFEIIPSNNSKLFQRYPKYTNTALAKRFGLSSGLAVRIDMLDQPADAVEQQIVAFAQAHQIPVTKR
ncbi:MAG: hypothetical protein WCN87_03005 [Chlamydiota bacterium]